MSHLTPKDISKLQPNQLLKRTVFSTKTGEPFYEYLVRYRYMGGTFKIGYVKPIIEPGVIVDECDLSGKPRSRELYAVRLSHLSVVNTTADKD